MSGLDVRSFTVGPVQENCYIVSAPEQVLAPDGLRPAVIVDPGDEPERLLEAAQALRVRIDAILLTHCHFDHVGAVAPVARATGAPVYCPELERSVLADVMSWVPPGFGPFESWEAEHTVAGGERLSPAGLEIDVIFTPGHSPGHVTYAIAASAPLDSHAASTQTDAQQSRATTVSLLSGDVLFQSSVGPRRPARRGLGDARALNRAGSCGPTRRKRCVYPGHMGRDDTRARAARRTPFSAELRLSAFHPPGGGRPRRDRCRKVSESEAQSAREARSTCSGSEVDARAPGNRSSRSKAILETAPVMSGSRRPPSRQRSCSPAASAPRQTLCSKEMFTFKDAGDRSLTLRPEGTAPVCRAYIEHGMHKRRQPVKLWYLSSFFRHERAQAGRYRQFWQVGAETIGSEDPAVDAEAIVAAGARCSPSSWASAS